MRVQRIYIETMIFNYYFEKETDGLDKICQQFHIKIVKNANI